MFTTTKVRSIAVNGTQLRVAVRPGRRGMKLTAPAPRVPLLLINGIGASLELLEPFVRQLDPAVDVIRFDPPGVGGSAQPALPYRFTGLCALIADMLTELGYDQVDVLGISWGGGVAQHFAAFQRARCRRLVLVATATGSLMVPGKPSALIHIPVRVGGAETALAAADGAAGEDRGVRADRARRRLRGRGRPDHDGPEGRLGLGA
jgi:pimeloyl-ACP methyl ester carboxylesterase